MSQIAAELKRLEQALDSLERGIAAREAERPAVSGAGGNATVPDADAVADRVERAIHRLESLLETP
ncbi:hypothetical protein [Inquilinus sp. CAU 1745]|uniref:hypothetical protein n=1 Tax=Inquilinus sp. CAU 1745 TaxID=3140369 RepID=UPI00325BB440